MRKLTLAAAALIAASPVTVMAQDAEYVPDGEAFEEPADETLGELAVTLSDPATQDRFAGMIATLSTVLLDLPLAPLAEAAADIAGEDAARDAADIDPDMTLRDMAPEAGDISEQAAEKLPRMMDAMAGMAGGLKAMLPALRDMAARMEDATEDLR